MSLRHTKSPYLDSMPVALAGGPCARFYKPNVPPRGCTCQGRSAGGRSALRIVAAGEVSASAWLV